MMSNNVSESEKEIPTGCVSFYTQWFDVCVCIRVRGLHLVLFFVSLSIYLSIYLSTCLVASVLWVCLLSICTSTTISLFVHIFLSLYLLFSLSPCVKMSICKGLTHADEGKDMVGRCRV